MYIEKESSNLFIKEIQLLKRSVDPLVILLNHRPEDIVSYQRFSRVLSSVNGQTSKYGMNFFDEYLQQLQFLTLRGHKIKDREFFNKVSTHVQTFSVLLNDVGHLVFDHSLKDEIHDKVKIEACLIRKLNQELDRKRASN